MKIKNVPVSWIVDGDTLNVIPEFYDFKKNYKIQKGKSKKLNPKKIATAMVKIGKKSFKIKLHKVRKKYIMKIRVVGLECAETKKCKKRKGKSLSRAECRTEKKKGKKALKKLIHLIKTKKVDLD